MIKDHWRRIAGIHACDDGTIAAVWMALDPDADTLHVYDTALFKREVLAVIAEGMNARSRWIPIAWEAGSKDFADKLLDRGCNTLPSASKDTATMAEVISRDIWERMRSGRFKVDKRLKEWIEEMRSFSRHKGKVPLESHPLMAATRHAVGMLEYARSQQKKRLDSKKVYPKLAVI